MAQPSDMILPLLHEMRAEMTAFRNETGERLSALESGQRSIRSALAADTVLSRMLIGEYEERIALETKVKALEGSK